MAGKVSGVSVLLKIGATAIGGQTGLSITRNMDTIDVTNKDDAATMAKSYLASWKDWSIDCDAFVVLGNAQQESLETAYADGTTVSVTIRTGATGDATGVNYAGTAFITDLSLDASKDDAVTYTVSLQGTGALTRTVAA
jgi:Predicted secreted protein